MHRSQQGEPSPAKKSIVGSEKELRTDSTSRAAHAVRQTRTRSRLAFRGKHFFKFAGFNIPVQVVRRRFDEGQHRVGPFVRDVGTSCPEDATPMLAQSARSLVRVKLRSIITVRNTMDGVFGFLTAQLCWLEAHLDRAISFSAWLTSRPRSSSS